MAVTNPIEHLAMAPKSLQTSIQNTNKIQRQEMAQAMQADKFQNDVKKSGSQTVKSQKSEYKEYRYDQKDESKKHKRHSDQREKEEKKEVDDPDDVSKKIGQSFDIRI